MLYRIEPLNDHRWKSFVETHPRASVFHSLPWLESLSRTYGYQPVAFTTTPPNKELQNGMVFCRVESWLTGRRLVSLPFSDHCEPLVQGPEQLQYFVDGLEQELRNENWRYIEIRPLQPTEITSSICRPAAEYSFHQLSLEADLASIFDNFHKSSTQRKILRAQREGIKCEEGSSDSLLDAFYPLLVATRRRHCVPPQPKSWFLNLMNCFGEALKIRLALKGSRPVAGMLTIRHKNSLVYKYGGSASQFHNLGGMHLLYWESLRDAKNSGLQVFDLGRTDANQAGLIKFKGRWGATRSSLTYLRFAESTEPKHFFDPANSNWKTRILKHGFAHVPCSVLSVLGNLLYKHVG